VHLNLSEDHLARHGTMENYAAIKKRLVAAAKYAVVGVDDLLSARMADALERDGHAVSRISAVHTVHDGVYAVGSAIWLARDGAQDELFDLGGVASLKGEHNAQNVCAVVASLLKLGMDPTKMAEAIRSFPGLAHRMEPVATIAAYPSSTIPRPPMLMPPRGRSGPMSASIGSRWAGKKRRDRST
jgi:UDP-N-acetylmuramoylalanine--D-glutamate ligase